MLVHIYSAFIYKIIPFPFLLSFQLYSPFKSQSLSHVFFSTSLRGKNLPLLSVATKAIFGYT